MAAEARTPGSPAGCTESLLQAANFARRVDPRRVASADTKQHVGWRQGGRGHHALHLANPLVTPPSNAVPGPTLPEESAMLAKWATAR
jgi:hypothetical protein